MKPRYRFLLYGFVLGALLMFLAIQQYALYDRVSNIERFLSAVASATAR